MNRLRAGTCELDALGANTPTEHAIGQKFKSRDFAGCAANRGTAVTLARYANGTAQT